MSVGGVYDFDDDQATGIHKGCDKELGICFWSDFKTKKKLSDARQYCSDLGRDQNLRMTLPIINSTQRSDFYNYFRYQYAGDAGQKSFWLDLHAKVDGEIEQQDWVWIDGDMTKTWGLCLVYYWFTLCFIKFSQNTNHCHKLEGAPESCISLPSKCLQTPPFEKFLR